TKTFQNLLAEAYLGAGGNLDQGAWRGALLRNGTTLLEADVDTHAILEAARSLGRHQEFPGLIKQRMKEVATQSGLCEWKGINRSRLTVGQLSSCGCARCSEWAEHVTAFSERAA